TYLHHLDGDPVGVIYINCGSNGRVAQYTDTDGKTYTTMDSLDGSISLPVRVVPGKYQWGVGAQAVSFPPTTAPSADVAVADATFYFSGQGLGDIELSAMSTTDWFTSGYGGTHAPIQTYYSMTTFTSPDNR